MLQTGRSLYGIQVLVTVAVGGQHGGEQAGEQHGQGHDQAEQGSAVSPQTRPGGMRKGTGRWTVG